MKKGRYGYVTGVGIGVEGRGRDEKVVMKEEGEEFHSDNNTAAAAL